MKPQTHFELHVVLGRKVPKDVRKLLVLICSSKAPSLEFIIDYLYLPNHPFFSVPGWQDLFRESTVTFVRLADDSYRLDAVGRTDLDEQDVGLFLRWLYEYLNYTGVFITPQYLGYIRSEVRPPNRQWLAYSVDQASLDARLRVSFVTRDNLLG